MENKPERQTTDEPQTATNYDRPSSTGLPERHSPHSPSHPKAQTRGRALLDDYRRRIAKTINTTDCWSLYNAETITDVAIYQHLDVDRSRYYKFLVDKINPRTWEARALTTFLLNSELPTRTWYNGDRVLRKKI